MLPRGHDHAVLSGSASRTATARLRQRSRRWGNSTSNAQEIAQALREENERAARAPALEAARRDLNASLRRAHRNPSHLQKFRATAATSPLLPEEKSGDMNRALQRSNLETLQPAEEAE